MIGSGEVIRRRVEKNARYITPYARKRRVFIIAEAGVNHNGSVRVAKKMVDAAKTAGADAVKFQTFSAEGLVSRDAPKAEYQKERRKESQLSMLKKLELDKRAHKKIINYCKKREIKFLSSPFDLKSIDLLKSYGLDMYKIPSGQITDLPFLKRIGALKKKVILSSGMSSLRDVEGAVRILVKAGTRRKDITVLHCNTEYPTPYRDVNLSAMLAIRKRLRVKAGYSDHTPGIEVPVAAASLGAEVIEKHFTLNKKMPGPDHKASLDPEELKNMVKAVRNIEEVLGDGIKRTTPSEFKNRDVVRKSIVASSRIKTGEIFTEENLTTKRPAKGISPMEWDAVVGRPAKRNFKKDELIEI
ncbi:MAG: N-acetylneuraminate synthase [Candidatus Omnitrophica bacterium]|nr:N-acetylneuraminate synthase [Candidatus Omnitrophota bacterium]